MKKISALGAILIITVLPTLVLAQSGIAPVPVPQDVGLGNLIVTIINFVFGVFLAVAALFIIYAAYLYLTSGGDPEKRKSANGWLIWAIVAIVVAFISRTIVTVVRNVLGT